MENNSDHKLEELHRLIGLEEAIQNVVRELRISIASVLRYASLIRSESQEIGIRQNVEKLYLEAQSASKVFDNVISQGSDKGKPSYEVCDAGSILGQACSLLDYQLKIKGILLDMIPSSEPLPVKADPFRLQQAFYIVLLNAVQLLIESQGAKRIRVTSGIEGNLVRIGISVTAPELFPRSGEDFLKQFFETVGKGMGMGWYTLQRTVARHNGTVVVEGGKIVSFLITLPCAVPGSVSVAVEAGAGIEETADLFSVRPAALIIDDEVMTGGVTAEMMNYLGFETVYVDCPLTALPALSARSFTVIMIDYLMPKMNGLDFIREHFASFGDAHVILMTGLSSLDVSEVDKTCQVRVLMKPFAFKELKCLVQEMKTKTRQQTN